MIYNFISSKAIIGKVYKDLKPSSPDFEADAMDWIGEALDFIGYLGKGVHKTINSEVKDNRAILPANLKELKSVWYNGAKLSLGGHLKNNGVSSDATYISKATSVLAQSNVEITRFGYPKTGSNINGDYYLLTPGYVLTSFEKGTIQLKCEFNPIDSDGYPLVPDSPYFKQALTWYILRQMIMGGFAHPSFNFDSADAQWKHYCSAAANDAMMHSPAEAERSRDNWVSMFIDGTQETDEFSELDINTTPDTEL